MITVLITATWIIISATFTTFLAIWVPLIIGLPGYFDLFRLEKCRLKSSLTNTKSIGWPPTLWRHSACASDCWENGVYGIVLTSSGDFFYVTCRDIFFLRRSSSIFKHAPSSMPCSWWSWMLACDRLSSFEERSQHFSQQLAGPIHPAPENCSGPLCLSEPAVSNFDFYFDHITTSMPFCYIR